MIAWIVWSIFWVGVGYFFRMAHEDIRLYQSGRDRWKPEYRRASDVIRHIKVVGK